MTKALHQFMDLVETYARGEREEFRFSRLNRLSKAIDDLGPAIPRLAELLAGPKPQVEAGALALVYIGKRVSTRDLHDALLAASPEVEGVLSALRECLPELDPAARTAALERAEIGLATPGMRLAALFLLEAAAKEGWVLTPQLPLFVELLSLPASGPAKGLNAEADRLKTPSHALRVLLVAVRTSEFPHELVRALRSLVESRSLKEEAQRVLNALEARQRPSS